MVARKVLLAVALLGTVAVGGYFATPDAPATTDESVAHLSATEVPDDRVADVADERRATFDSLSESKRDEFVSAVNDESVEAEAWTSGSEIEYVKYDGDWYEVEVHLV